MRGSPKSQVNHLLLVAVIFLPGISKHEQKLIILENYRNMCIVLNIVSSAQKLWHTLGKNLYIYSYSTLYSYRKVWIQVVTFIRENYTTKNMENIDAIMIHDFLHKAIDRGVARSTFDAYASALVKLELALNIYSVIRGSGKIYNFELEPGCDVRERATEELTEEIKPRAYYDPSALVSALDGLAQLIAEIQYFAGPRIFEVLTLKRENLVGNGVIHLTNTKGGLERSIMVPDNTYTELLKHIEANGDRFLLPGQKVEGVAAVYRRQLQKAAIQTNQCYHGTHGLRWNFAQEDYNKYLMQGMTPKEAIRQVSLDLGHKRPEVVARYLR